MTIFLLVGLLFTGFGMFFVVSGRRRSRAWKCFVGSAQVTQAEVLELRLHVSQHADGASGYWYSPLVRFHLLDGRVVEAETMTGSSPAPARVGEVVMVRFDPADPTRVNLADGPAQGSSIGCAHTALGAGFVVLGLLVLLLWVFLELVIELPT